MKVTVNSITAVVIGALLLLLAFQFSLLGLLLVIMLMMGYTYWKWINKEKSKSEVKNFVSSYFKPNEVWPSKIQISKEEINNLHEKLISKKINIPENMLDNLVETEIIKQIEARFETSFYEHNKGLPKRPTEYEWIQAYAKTFKKNMDYVPLLKRLAKKRGASASIKSFTERITAEVNRQGKVK